MKMSNILKIDPDSLLWFNDDRSLLWLHTKNLKTLLLLLDFKTIKNGLNFGM